VDKLNKNKPIYPRNNWLCLLCLQVLEDQNKVYHHGRIHNHPIYIFISDEEQWCFYCSNCDENISTNTTANPNTNVRNTLEEIHKIILEYNSQRSISEESLPKSMEEHDQSSTNFSSHDRQSAFPLLKGLVNLGNTCYMNSALQALFRSINSLEDVDVIENNDLIISIELSNLFKLLNSDNDQNHNKTAISPHKFLNAFAIRNGIEWRQGLQQDSHEFIRRLFNNLDDEKAKKPKSLFAGKVKHTTCCENCMKNTHVEELFMDLSLPLQQRNTTLENLLVLFEEPVELKHENSYACENCKKLCPATRQSRVIEWPDILMIHLERFALKRPSPGMGMFFKNLFDYGKLHDHISFRSIMDYGGQSYTLIALVVHEGYSADYGHYISYIEKNEQWYHISDSNVQNRNLENVISSNPYLLFYKKVAM